MHGISRLFSDFLPNFLTDSENMTGSFHTHQTAVVRLAVKRGADRNPSLSKFRFYVKRNLNISTVDVRYLFNLRVELVNLSRGALLRFREFLIGAE